MERMQLVRQYQSSSWKSSTFLAVPRLMFGQHYRWGRGSSSSCSTAGAVPRKPQTVFCKNLSPSELFFSGLWTKCLASVFRYSTHSAHQLTIAQLHLIVFLKLAEIFPGENKQTKKSLYLFEVILFKSAV